MIQNKEIAIIGGGPGGLTLARLLQKQNAKVKVYERDINKNTRVQGTTLDLHQDAGLKAIRAANLLEAFKKHYRPGADKMMIANAQAEILFSDHDERPEADFENEHFRPEIDRGPLRQMLLESLNEDTVVWDSQFLSMEKCGEGWQLLFKNGKTYYADLVIGADGARSKVRPYVTPITSFYTGISGMLGTVPNYKTTLPNIEKLIKGGKVMAFGDSKFFTLATKGDGSLSFYLSFKTIDMGLPQIDFNSTDEAKKWFKKEYAEWAELWSEVFKYAELPFMPIPIYCMPLDQTWQAHANLTLLGDAAHVMPPFAGEGVNVAMLDALELSQYLCNNNFTTLQEAIAHYENNMRQRAAISAKGSLENGERMHSEHSLQNMLTFFRGMEV